MTLLASRVATTGLSEEKQSHSLIPLRFLFIRCDWLGIAGS